MDPEDAAPSPAAADAPAEAAPIVDTPVADAGSGSAKPGENDASPPDAPVSERDALLAVVKAVAAPKNPTGEDQAKPEPSSTEPAHKDPKTPAEPDVPDTDPDATELSSYAPKTRKRIEKLLGQRNTARNETENLKPAAQKWSQMEGYLTRNDLAAEDVNLLLGVGAALRRGDFKAFLDGVGPYVDLANRALGQTLPPDLQAKVDAGEMVEDAAKELSVSRIKQARLEGEAARRAKQDTEASEGQVAAREAAAARDAVVQWEAGIKQRDPDYGLKVPMVVRISQALVQQHGRPRTPEHAVAMAKAAYEEATRLMGTIKPQPAATKPQPSGARAVNGAQPEPRSLMEAALQGLSRSRRQ